MISYVNKDCTAPVVILLTGCVDPKLMSFTALIDVRLREEHYLSALEFYYRQTDVPIVLTENSNHVFQGEVIERLLSSGRVEILNYDGNNFPKELGKGYGELESIIYGLKHSKFINGDTKIVKITGRQQVINIRTFLNSANSGGIVDHFLYFRGQKKAASELYITNKNFIENYLSKNHHLINDTEGVYFEHVLATTIMEYSNKGNKYELLSSYPRLLGIRGTENLPHRTSSVLFWFCINLLYKVVKSSYFTIDKLILRYFQG